MRGESTSNLLSSAGGQVASSSVLPVTAIASSLSVRPPSGEGEGMEGQAGQWVCEEGDDTPAHYFCA